MNAERSHQPRRPCGRGGGTQGKWLSPRVVNLALQYLTVAVKAARTWKVLQPHVPQLMARVLFPLMCFDDADAELWEDDPQEYVRKVCRRAPSPPPPLFWHPPAGG